MPFSHLSIGIWIKSRMYVWNVLYPLTDPECLELGDGQTVCLDEYLARNDREVYAQLFYEAGCVQEGLANPFNNDSTRYFLYAVFLFLNLLMTLKPHPATLQDHILNEILSLKYIDFMLLAQSRKVKISSKFVVVA